MRMNSNNSFRNEFKERSALKHSAGKEQTLGSYHC